MIEVARPFVGLRERLAVSRVLKSGNLAQGSEVAKFEGEFSDTLLDGRPVVAVNSGTSGLHLGLVACGIGRGDEVIVPSFTFAATPNSVVLAGAKPVFCDIDNRTFNIDPDRIKDLIGPKTKGIMPVHLFGHPAAMGRILEVASTHGLSVYEDAAQAHGASENGRPVGTFGAFAMFSLYPTKNMTSGEGGMVSCAEDENARRIKLLRNQGMETQYQNEIVGYNNRMSDVHASIGRVQLTRINLWNENRRRNAQYLQQRISEVTNPFEAPGARHVYHQYTLRIPENRDGFAKALRKEFGIGSGVYYPVPTHRLQSLRDFARGVDLPETERASAEVLSIPVHPALTRSNLDLIAKAVNVLGKAGGHP